jgi:hypothetical protein
MRLNILSLIILSLISNSFCEEFKRSELGVILGWGSPNGNGVEYSYYVIEPLNINVGAGITLSGGKLSLGSKYYFLPQKFASPFVGLNLTNSSGLSSINVNVNNDSAKYSIEKAVFITPRVGWRFKTNVINWYVNAGYGIVLTGGGSKYISGSTSSSVKDFSKVVSAGGIEISASMMFKF